jgi:FKBP-type peptidyl-prolyl cis-trans isomerase SlyD
VLSFRVTAIEGGKITLDGNNPLAGRVARCVAEVLSLRDATPEEVKAGFPAEQGAPQLH